MGSESLGRWVAPSQNALFCVLIHMGAMDLAAVSVRPPDAHRLEGTATAGRGEFVYPGRNLANPIITYGRKLFTTSAGATDI